MSAHGQTATATTLAVTSGGNPAATVSQGAIVTLTATVVSGTTPVTLGQVRFCVLSSTAACSDIHLLTTAQLTGAGTAVYKFRPGPGAHSYKAVFLGTPNGKTAYAGSASGAAALTVTATISPSVTQVVEASTHDNPNAPYPLTLTVGGTGSAPPTGTVTFVNTSDSNAVLGTATLGAGESQLSLLNYLNGAPAGLDFQARYIVTGDFNGDGIPDVAAISYGELGIFLGDGNGGFTVKTYTGPNGSNYSGLVTGDFNGDGVLDLATTNINNTLVVLLGNGDGTFTAVPNPPSEPATSGLAVADFNQDGIPDLALADGNSGTTIILLGNGDGTFTGTASNPVGSGNIVGDFNGDGIPDLAVLNVGSTVTNVPSSLSILLGNGDGTFQQPISNVATGGAEAQAMVAADFNGDGALDLALEEETDSTAGTWSIAVLLGDGHGGFAAPAFAALPSPPGPTMAVADFNQDGNPDLAMVSFVPFTQTGMVTAIPGNGDGTFSTSTEAASTAVTAASGNEMGLVAADLNGDGYPDLVWGNDDGLPVFITATQIAGATISTPLILPPGYATETVLANYPGDSNYNASASLPFTLTEVPYTPTVTVAPSSSSITPSQAITVVITVSGGAGVPTPTGSASLISQVYGSTDYASESFPLSDGAASIAIPAGSLIPGPNTITVSYSGDNDYLRTTGTAPVTVVGPDFALSNTPVNIASAGTGGSSTITVTPANGFTGSVALSCAVTATPKITGVLPTCSIPSPLAITGTSPVTATLNLGTQVNTASGNYTVTVTGTSGDITPSTNVSVTIASPTGATIPIVTVTPSSASIADNQPDSVTVTVAGASGSATPTGLLAIYTGSYYAQQTLTSGSSTFTIAAGTLSTGANTIGAIYSGDTNYTGEGGSTTITVYDLDASSSVPAAVSPGTSATVTVTLNAGNGFGGTWNLSCALTQSPSGAQSLPACKLSPATLQLTDGVNTSTTMTVTTTAASTTSELVRPDALPDSWPGSSTAGGSIALAGLLLVGLRRKRRLLMIVLIFAAGMLVNGCGSGGSGSSSSQPPPVTTPATTAGNYIFTVTGTDSDKANTAVSVNVTVTVQ